MSVVLAAQNQIHQEKILDKSRQIQKQKRKNQYTVDFKFGSSIDVSTLKSNLTINQNIPLSIHTNLVFRLNSNIQFPIVSHLEEQLGELQIDPHSYNYKVVRYDRRNTFHILNLEPIQRPITTLEKVKELLIKEGNSLLIEGLEQFHQKNIDVQKYNLVSEEKLKEFENSINGPMTLYIQRNKNGFVSTLARVMNNAYLQMIGINEEMLSDYVFQTGLIPQSFAGDGDQSWSSTLGHVFKSNAQLSFGQLIVTNYKGQKFPILLKSKNFHIYDKEDDSYTEFLYYKYEVDFRYLKNEQVQENCNDYFNRKINISTDETNEVEFQKRCKYRLI